MASEDDDSDSEGGLELPGGNIIDWAHELHYEHRTRDWDASFSHARLGGDFHADLGHVSRVGFQSFTLNGGPTWYGDSDDLITRFSVDSTYSQINELNGGGLLERELEFGARLRGARQSSFTYEFILKRESFEDLLADLIDHSMRGSIRPFGDLDIEMDVSFGDAIDYSHARVGSRLDLTPEISVNLGKHIRIDLRMNSPGSTSAETGCIWQMSLRCASYISSIPGCSCGRSCNTWIFEGIKNCTRMRSILCRSNFSPSSCFLTSSTQELFSTSDTAITTKLTSISTSRNQTVPSS